MNLLEVIGGYAGIGAVWTFLLAGNAEPFYIALITGLSCFISTFTDWSWGIFPKMIKHGFRGKNGTKILG